MSCPCVHNVPSDHGNAHPHSWCSHLLCCCSCFAFSGETHSCLSVLWQFFTVVFSFRRPMLFPRVDPCSGWVWKVLPARTAGQQFCPEFSCGQTSVDLPHGPYSSILLLSARDKMWAERKLLWQTSLRFDSLCWCIKNKWFCFSLCSLILR